MRWLFIGCCTGGARNLQVFTINPSETRLKDALGLFKMMVREQLF
jgi:hypothetical protein